MGLYDQAKAVRVQTTMPLSLASPKPWGKVGKVELLPAAMDFEWVLSKSPTDKKSLFRCHRNLREQDPT